VSKLRLAPKPTKATPSVDVHHWPGYQALRLRGLAGLLRGTGDHFPEVNNMDEVMFYLASALDEIAEALEPVRRS